MSEPSAQMQIFLFTDIEGSTRLWELHPDAMQEALAQHDRLIREAIAQHGGHVFKTIGDAFCATFPSILPAAEAAIAAQLALQGAVWGVTGPLRVRMALHYGQAIQRDNDYFGPALNRVARILAAAHGAQTLLSRSAFLLLHESLPAPLVLRSLGEHRLKDLLEPEPIYQLLHPDLPSDFPPLKSLGASTNLPRQLSSFIGREREMEELRSHLAQTHLLTLFGPGGAGKTRLALQLGTEALNAYSHGVWIVELASLSQPNLVLSTIASALGVREEAQHTVLDTLTNFLNPRHLLLILDNCEHLMSEVVQSVHALLRACPQLTILATSRERLNVPGEHLYPLSPLSLPGKQARPTPEFILQSEAVRLFVERATACTPQFLLTPQNAPAVAHICRRLDGIPLAIELAAARVRVLPPEQIEKRLQDRFRLLTGGSRIALPHQQTLRALIDWSYDLLDEEEKQLLQAVTVFTDGWTLAAAVAICGDDAMDEYALLDLLVRLVDKSLVTLEAETPDSAGRYVLLESVRQYGQEKLLQAGEADTLQARHADYFTTWAQEVAPHLNGAEQARWLDSLEAEHGNLRGALATWKGQQATTRWLALCNALTPYWEVRGYVAEGRNQLTEALTLASPRDQRTEFAASLANLGRMAFLQGDYATALERYQQSLSHYQEDQNEEGIARLNSHLGDVACAQGDLETSQQRHETSLAQWRKLNVPQAVSTELTALGLLAFYRHQWDEAKRLFEEGLQMAIKAGSRRDTANAYSNLAMVVWEQGDLPAAQEYDMKSLDIRREINDRQGVAISLNNLAEAAMLQNRLRESYHLYCESLDIFWDLDDRRSQAYALEGLASLAWAQGNALQSVRLYGTASRLRDQIGAPLLPSDQPTHSLNQHALREALGETAFQAAWQSGWEQDLTVLFDSLIALELDQNDARSTPAT